MNAKAKAAQDKYLSSLETQKATIKKEPNRLKRFFKWVWLLVKWPFLWLWASCKDWRTLLVFALVLLGLSSEVWVPYIIGFLATDAALKATMLSVASACWLFWLLPATPFIPLCIVITMGIMEIIHKKERGKNAKAK